mmetsp:Transcript_37947/g.94297  ORF Transcript_37947/g.94297 Transcript_37947/m.94297 type:complete len:208 (+) Transcript_37947:1100-1723(+)
MYPFPSASNSRKARVSRSEAIIGLRNESCRRSIARNFCVFACLARRAAVRGSCSRSRSRSSSCLCISASRSAACCCSIMAKHAARSLEVSSWNCIWLSPCSCTSRSLPLGTPPATSHGCCSSSSIVRRSSGFLLSRALVSLRASVEAVQQLKSGFFLRMLYFKVSLSAVPRLSNGCSPVSMMKSTTPSAHMSIGRRGVGEVKSSGAQ